MLCLPRTGQCASTLVHDCFDMCFTMCFVLCSHHHKQEYVDLRSVVAHRASLDRASIAIHQDNSAQATQSANELHLSNQQCRMISSKGSWKHPRVLPKPDGERTLGVDDQREFGGRARLAWTLDYFADCVQVSIQRSLRA